MKITKSVVKLFEQEQKAFGTAVALQNVLWTVASTLLLDLGIKHIKTSRKPPKKS